MGSGREGEARDIAGYRKLVSPQIRTAWLSGLAGAGFAVVAAICASQASWSDDWAWVLPGLLTALIAVVLLVRAVVGGLRGYQSLTWSHANVGRSRAVAAIVVGVAGLGALVAV